MNKVKNTQDKREHKRRWPIIVAVVLLFILLLLLLLRSCGGDTLDEPVPSFAPRPNRMEIVYDPNAVEGGWEEADPEAILATLNEKVAEGLINISMNTTPVFQDSSAPGNLMIVNETVNRYPQVVEITRNDTGELIYRSGAIPVGSKVETAQLLVPLDAGTYECTALFYNVDLDSGTYLGCAGAIIHITILN